MTHLVGCSTRDKGDTVIVYGLVIKQSTVLRRSCIT
jgi:hypothetical protein